MKRAIPVLGVLCILLAGPLLGGCVSQAERDFVTADVKIIGQYVAQAQPAVEMYCLSLESQGGDQALQGRQLRADTQALAEQIIRDQQTRLDKLSAEKQAVASAQAALDFSLAVLKAYGATGADANE
ncbi:MAG: hypothetical protein WC789_13835 [Lentisphaeria bacterium]